MVDANENTGCLRDFSATNIVEFLILILICHNITQYHVRRTKKELLLKNRQFSWSKNLASTR